MAWLLLTDVAMRLLPLQTRLAVLLLAFPSAALATPVGADAAPSSSDAAPPTIESLAEQNRQLAEQNRHVMERLKAFDQKMQLMAAQIAATQATQAASAPDAAAPGDPFAWGDFTWVNGATRQATRLLDTKYFTPQFDVDLNYTYSFNNPIDHTIVGSTATFRSNELELAFLGIGGDLHVRHVRGRIFFQYGERAVGVPRNDVTINRGQYDLLAAMRYLSEAYAGYHWDKMHGINLDVGLFFSYVGLFSYTQFENWGYQASFTSDNTPWFFNGARLQLFPSDRLKVELWLINGWQTYGKFNELPGVGYQIQYSGREWYKLVFNGYVGTDTQDHPGRVRFHSDNSFLVRYLNRPGSNGVSRMAFSLTFDLGFEQGDGVAAFHGNGKEGSCTHATPCEQDFVSGMLYNNTWFWKNRFSWLVGGGFIHNPGRYLVLVPAGVASTFFDTNSGTKFDGWDFSTNISYYPTDYITFRLESSYHAASVPYYSGHGGVTGPDGYKCGGLYSADGTSVTCNPPGWTPDLVRHEEKLILAVLFRI